MQIFKVYNLISFDPHTHKACVFVFIFKDWGTNSLYTILSCCLLSVLGQNTKRESGRKVQSGNINAAKVACLWSCVKCGCFPPASPVLLRLLQLG